MMALEEVLKQLGVDECPDAIKPYWDESMACFPAETPCFLQPARIAENAAWGGFDASVIELIQTAARRIRENPNLARLAWHCYRLTFERLDTPAPALRAFPNLDAALQNDWGLFYLLVTLEAVPRGRAFHQQRGIPEDISRLTMSELSIHSASFKDFYGYWGMRQRTLYWFRHHAVGEIYRTGRMQYIVKPFRPGVRAYRHRRTGAVVALAEDGLEFDADGYMNDGATAPAKRQPWTSRFVEADGAVTGNPVAPMGFALRREVRLPLDVWQPALKPGDGILEMHIPAGGGMTLEAAGDSMRRAAEFFPRYFPELPFVGFGCWSWIFNTQLEEMLSAEANLVRYMRQLYLFPLRSDGRAGLYFIFGDDHVDPATAPRDTSVRRALLDILASGRGLRNGAMFFLKEDLDRFGTAPYRSQWPPKGLGL